MTAVPSVKHPGLGLSLPQVSLFGLLLGLAISDLHAQSWRERQTLVPRRRAGIAYDPSRERVVTFGGALGSGGLFGSTLRETWEWDSATWTRRNPTELNEPNQSDNTRGMIYDPISGRVLLLNFPSSSEFYRWEGKQWASVVVANRPNFRQNFAITYDELRRRIVMWGGQDQVTGAQVDVWEYDGTNWAPTSAPGPAGRNDPALGWDGVRGKVIMFGGRTLDATPTPLNDMYEWNGQTWTRLTPATLPPARNQHSMTWDPIRRKLVLFGGGTGLPGTLFNDTWEWDGTNWTRVATANSPQARCGHGAIYHPARRTILVAFGESVGTLRGDMWEYNGTNWTVAAPEDAPPARADHAAAFDNDLGTMVVFGGQTSASLPLNDTWIWNTSRWTLATPATSPSVRFNHAMAYDGARHNMVMFGGLSSGLAQNDTWIWDGATSTWTLANPASRPTARSGHAMAFDGTRGRVVLFGGALPVGTLLNDTWEWDGTTWSLVTPTASPPGRADHAMTYDAARNEVLCFGGRTGPATYVQDLWGYDGLTWTLRPPGIIVPSVRGNLGFAFDTRLGKAYLFSGQTTATTYASNTYEWNGTAWASVAAFPTPTLRGGHSMVWDSIRRRLVMFGGENAATARRADLWMLSTNTAAAVATNAASGCGGGTATPASIQGFGAPTLGNPSFALDLITPNPPTNSAPVFFLLSAAQGSGSFGGSCPLWVDANTLFLTAYRIQINGLATLPLPIPPVTSLIGGQVFAQCLYVDPPSQFNGIAFSRGTTVTIGDY